MPTARKTAAPAPETTRPKLKAASSSTALAQYDEELAQLAKEAAAQEAGVGGGKSFSTKGGVLSYDGNDMDGNKVAVIILTSRLENVFYNDKYDEDNPSPPDCYAFGTDEKTMVPHEQAAAKQADACDGCPHNEWGSADTGRGKRCRNIRRLALLPAGLYDKKTGEFVPYTTDQLEAGNLAFLKVPPTSITAFASYVKGLTNSFAKPPLMFFTEISLKPSKSNQFSINFEALDEVPSDVIGMLLKRRKEAEGVIEQPYGKKDEETPKGKAAVKKTAGRRKY